MAETVCAAHGCDQPTTARLCRQCLDRLCLDLRDLAYKVNAKGVRTPGLFGNLLDARYKLTNVQQGSGKTVSREIPLPFNPAAADLATEVTESLLGWMRALATARSLRFSETARSTGQLALWFLDQRSDLAAYDAVDQMADDIGSLVDRIKRLVDRYEAAEIYLGVCGAELAPQFERAVSVCSEALYGDLRNTTVRCKVCRTEHDAHDRWVEIQDRVRDSLATAAEIAGACRTFYGRSINVKTIRTWASRGQITTYGTNRDGVAQHHVAEVFRVAEQSQRRRAKVAA